MSKSRIQYDELSDVQRVALQFIPLAHCAFAFLIVAQANGYLEMVSIV